MKKLLIVFHSKTGGTYQMVQAAAKGGASEPDVATNLIHAAEAGPDELLQADGYIFATPENLAMMSGVMKDFFDRTYYPVLDRIVGRPYTDSHLRRQRRRKRRASDSTHRRRLAPQSDRRADHRLYPRADAEVDPRAETDRRLRFATLRRDRRDLGGGLNSGDLLDSGSYLPPCG